MQDDAITGSEGLGERPPLQVADMPERTASFWKLAGPGAVLVGLSIGAGEIIVWPRIAAQYGGSMVWAAILGVFLQLWINFEIARWPVARRTRERLKHSPDKLSRLPWRRSTPICQILKIRKK